MATPEPVHDPGLQQERTVLAWDRTGLALMVGAGLLARAVEAPRVGPVTLVAASVFALGFGLLIFGRNRYLARWRRMRAGRGMLSVGPVVAVATATGLLGVSALIWVVRSVLSLSLVP